MSNPIIVLGDKTSHGGTVVTCSPVSDTHGKGWARVGDMVSCPRCKGVFPISQGDSSLIDAGKAVAYHGCKTACGATLISSQMYTLTTPSGGAAPGATSTLAPGALMQGFGIIHTGLASAYQDEPIEDDSERFRGRFPSAEFGDLYHHRWRIEEGCRNACGLLSKAHKFGFVSVFPLRYGLICGQLLAPLD